MSDLRPTPETDEIHLDDEIESLEIRYNMMSDHSENLERQRDELLEACQMCVDQFDDGDDHPMLSSDRAALRAARAAIAKAKEGEL